jgi:hypothetical protein
MAGRREERMQALQDNYLAMWRLAPTSTYSEKLCNIVGIFICLPGDHK